MSEDISEADYQDLKASVEEKLRANDYQDTDLVSGCPRYAVVQVRGQLLRGVEQDFLTWSIIKKEKEVKKDKAGKQDKFPLLNGPPLVPYFVGVAEGNIPQITEVLRAIFWDERTPDQLLKVFGRFLPDTIPNCDSHYLSHVAFPAFFNRFVSSEYLDRAATFLKCIAGQGLPPSWWAMCYSFLLHAPRFVQYLRDQLLSKLREPNEVGQLTPDGATELLASAFCASLPRLTSQHLTIVKIAFAKGAGARLRLANMRTEFVPSFLVPIRAIWQGSAEPQLDEFLSRFPNPLPDTSPDVFFTKIGDALGAADYRETYCPSAALADVTWDVTVPHFLSELDLAILAGIAGSLRTGYGETWVNELPITPLKDQDDSFRRSLRIFEVPVDLGGRRLEVDESVVPVVRIDPELQRRWAEIERRAEDRGVNPRAELPNIDGERPPLTVYGLRQLLRRLELTELRRDAVRARLAPLGLLAHDAKALATTVRALEIVAARQIINPTNKDPFTNGVPDARLSVVVEVAAARAREVAAARGPRVGAERSAQQEWGETDFRRKLRRRLENERFGQHNGSDSAIAAAADEIRGRFAGTNLQLPGGPEPMPPERIEESLALLNGLLRGLGIAFLDQDPTTFRPDIREGKAEIADWEPARRKCEEWKTEFLLMQRYKESVATGKLGQASLALAELILILGEYLPGIKSCLADPDQLPVKEVLLAKLSRVESDHTQFALAVGKLHVAITSDKKIPLYKDVKRAIREAFRLVAVKSDVPEQ